MATTKQQDAQASTPRIGRSYDQLTEDTFRESSLSIYRKPLENFCLDGSGSITEYKAILSMKSFPNGVFAAVITKEQENDNANVREDDGNADGEDASAGDDGDDGDNVGETQEEDQLVQVKIQNCVENVERCHQRTF
ncbi:Tricalbin-2 [Mucor velutinosus]|uniref:Tricalbin-2 n=1 Tax=Mucor velutinosus TaxID=708070 RepID=A0AAN7DRS8_9FUNG|nr:Tricalbin-2 [Mucor velutinosus]